MDCEIFARATKKLTAYVRTRAQRSETSAHKRLMQLKSLLPVRKEAKGRSDASSSAEGQDAERAVGQMENEKRSASEGPGAEQLNTASVTVQAELNNKKMWIKACCKLD
jgi:flagellar motor switch/type III secretory pathway protein FliN